ncbi:class A beta-lactamase, partial [Clavibacter michiganensis subsp. michiganensis]|nr:class A beta-lactamase [Clavibacter michiganensis subsp. michiganensis]
MIHPARSARLALAAALATTLLAGCAAPAAEAPTAP